jgi:four helix bundle protein
LPPLLFSGAALSAAIPTPRQEFLRKTLGTQLAMWDGMGPTEADRLRARFRAFAVRVVKFARTLPADGPSQNIARQLTRAGTGASANYHSACRGRSRAEFIARLAIALDEADEACMWLDVIKEGGITQGDELEWLIDESGELRAILFASVNTARLNQRATH